MVTLVIRGQQCPVERTGYKGKGLHPPPGSLTPQPVWPQFLLELCSSHTVLLAFVQTHLGPSHQRTEVLSHPHSALGALLFWSMLSTQKSSVCPPHDGLNCVTLE